MGRTLKPIVDQHAPFVPPELAQWNESMRSIPDDAFTPLVVQCTLTAPIFAPDRRIALDGLLAAAVARRTQLPPASSAHECAPIEIPVKRSPCGRLHLASNAQFAIEKRAHSFTNKRFPTKEAQSIGCTKTVRRVLETTGASKGFRIPRELLHVKDDIVVWYCLGIREKIQALLIDVTSLGKRRAVGLGAIVPGSWSVETCERWDGFPVLLNGQPLRPLPLDWPGLTAYEPGFANMTYPYWDRSKENDCALQPSEW